MGETRQGMTAVWLALMLAGLLCFGAACEYKDSPVDISAALSEVATYEAAGAYQAGLAVLDDAANAQLQAGESVSARIWQGRGHLYMQQGRWAAAERALQQALLIAPGHYTSTVDLAEAQRRQGQSNLAFQTFTAAIALDAQHAAAWLGLGKTYLDQGSYQLAADTFTRAAELAQDVTRIAEANWYLALLTLSTDRAAGQIHLAAIPGDFPPRDYLQSTLDTLPVETPPSEVALRTGIALTQLELWPPAHHAFQTAVQLDPMAAQAWAFLGYAESSLGRPAAGSFARARRLDPTLALTPYFEGIDLRRQGEYDAALEQFLLALDLDPNNLAVATEAAYTLAEQGNYLSAEAWYIGIVQLAPDDPVYLEQLAAFYLQYRFRVNEAALPTVERLIELAPERPRAYDLLGQTHYQAGRYAAAENALRQALERDPDYIPALYHLGQVLTQRNRSTEAQTYFTRVIDLDQVGTYRQRILKE